MVHQLQEILSHFAITHIPTPHGSGHINTTYLVDTTPKYILQRINTDIFTRPDQVMANIVAVTEYLREKITAAGGDPERETLRVIPTIDGKAYYTTPTGDVYRLYNFIKDSRSYDIAETPEMFAASAHGFGRFQRMLDGFPADKLYETIPHFHDTGDRLRQFREALEKDTAGRAKDVQPEITFVLAHADCMTRVTDALADGSLPLRVTHNDTKLNNVMLDDVTGEAVCVVDLDTVMPGSLLYDYGDSLRFGASTGAEDETDLSKIEFDLTYFEAYTRAFLEELGDTVTEKELELMPFSALLLTLECGMRFLTDHLNGDTYFRIHRPNHNLDRCRTQFKLITDIEKKLPAMEEIVRRAAAELCSK